MYIISLSDFYTHTNIPKLCFFDAHLIYIDTSVSWSMQQFTIVQSLYVYELYTRLLEKYFMGFSSLMVRDSIF